MLPIAFSILFSCSSSEKTEKKTVDEKKKETEVVNEPTTDINLELNKLYAWVNLMPGEQPKFHITGDVVILNEKNVISSETKLVRVKVFQNKNLHYIIKPTVRMNDEIKSESGNAILFSTIRGLSLNPGFNYEKPINLVLIFEENEKTYSYPVNDVKIDKAY